VYIYVSIDKCYFQHQSLEADITKNRINILITTQQDIVFEATSNSSSKQTSKENLTYFVTKFRPENQRKSPLHKVQKKKIHRHPFVGVSPHQPNPFANPQISMPNTLSAKQEIPDNNN
jgi:hypothetical protein